MRIFLFFILTILLSCTNAENSHTNDFIGASYSFSKDNNTPKLPSPNKTYKVTKVKDGDTIEILVDKTPLVIRLEHIDCPEKKQPFGQKAKNLTSSLTFGKMVKIKYKKAKLDRYKRLVAEVILPNNINVNQELVRKGLAWHYKTYSKSEIYAKLEKQARKEKIGLWSEKNPINPADWRKGLRK